MAYKPKAPEVMAAPNVIPMADIMLVLLIIFMVITPMIQNGVDIDMAKVLNAEALRDASKDNAITLAITRDGVIFLSIGTANTQKMALTTISDRVKDLVTNRIDKTVYVKCDARAKFKVLKDTVDQVRSAGVENIGLLTEKVQVSTGAAPPPPPPAPGG